MRDYLYIWNDHSENRLVLSGVEYKDMKSLLTGRNILLLKSEYDDPQDCSDTNFEYISRHFLEKSFESDVDFGDFYWVDFTSDSLSVLSKSEICELLYARHMGSSFSKCFFESLASNYIYIGHDDGWYLSLYYKNSAVGHAAVTHFLSILGNKNITPENIFDSSHAFWLSSKAVDQVEKTTDIDHIMNKML